MEKKRTLVLLVEDDKSYANFIQEAIRDNVEVLFDIIHAESFKEAVGYIDREDIGVILLDLLLPDTSGLKTFYRIKEKAGDVPIVIITSLADEGLAIEALKEGAEDYLFKVEVTPNNIVRSLKYAVERKRAHEETRRSEEKLRTLFLEFPLPSFTWRHSRGDLLLVDYNKAAIDVSGGQISKYLNMSANEFHHDEPMILEEMWRCFKEGTIIKKELEYRYKSTELKKLLTVTFVPIPPDSLFIYTEDITDRKVAENELKRSRDELELKVKERTAELSEINEKLTQEIEERRRVDESLRIRDWAMQSSISGIVLLDLNGVVTYVNPSFLNMWGYKDPEAVIGISVIELWHEEHKMSELLDTLKYTESWIGEVIAKKNDGSMFDVQLSASIVKNEDGNPISIMGSIVDITDRKKLEEELWILSITDSLTGLFNQRHFYRKIEEETARAKRMSYPLCLMIFDLDSFKQYNDKYGHQKGNDVLRDIGEITKKSIRKDVDSAFRYGGDEFAVILPNAGKEDALEVAKRIENTVSKKYKSVGISFGIELLKEDHTIDDLIRETDVAMYKEKGLKIKKGEKE